MEHTFAYAALAGGRVRQLVDRIARIGSQLEPGDGKDFGVGWLFNAGNVAAEKVLEALARDLTDRGADVDVLVVELALFRELIVHQAEDVVERFVVVGGVADFKIEQLPEDLP